MFIGISLPVGSGLQMPPQLIPILIFSIQHKAPQHAETDFVARLNQIRRSPCRHQFLQTFLRILPDGLRRIPTIDIPGRWNRLLTRIGPSVTIMEVEHEVEPGILDALTQFLHICQILADGLILPCRIHEESNANGIPSLLFHENEHVGNGFPIFIEIRGTLFLIFGQQGEVAPHVQWFLCRRLHGNSQQSGSD